MSTNDGDGTATGAIELEPHQLREAYSYFPTGVTAVCGVIDGQPLGLVCSSFTSVSLAPPLVSVCVQTTSRTWPKLRESSRLGLNVLADDQGDACRQLSGPEEGRFMHLPWQIHSGDAIFLEGALAWFDCTTSAEIPAGDHTIVLLEVQGLWLAPLGDPLIFHGSRFRRLEAHAEHVRVAERRRVVTSAGGGADRRSEGDVAV